MIRMLCPEPQNFSEKGLAYAKSKVEFTSQQINQAEFELRAPEFEAVLIRFNTQVGSKVMGKNSNLKSVLSPTTGLDHIDFDAAKNHNVDIFHLKGQKKFLNSISGTAEHTIALMLALLRKIPSSFEAFKTGQWEQGSFRGREVSGKTLGIVGYGRLGKKVARIGLAFGMKIAVYDPYIDSFPKNTISYKSFFNLLPEIDILSIHVPLLVETKHLIGLREIELMKPGSILINTSRGDVVSTQALIKALQSGHLAGAALDVIDREHCIEKEGHPLIAFAKDNDNLLVTPHIGGSTYESVEKTDLFILKRFFQSI